MSKIIDIHSVFESEIVLIQKQSALLLQKKENGFNGELKSAGAIVENYVKGLLLKHFPNDYRICSGYIATPHSFNGAENLIQHDIIIIDNRMPALYKFGIGDIEIVAAEAVCGVIEVKRTLNKKTLNDAINQLEITKRIFDEYDGGLKSKNKAPKTLNHSFSDATLSPMFAIIGLDAKSDILEEAFLKNIIAPSVINFVDLIWSPTAPFLAAFTIQLTKDNKKYSAPNVSRNHEGYYPDCLIDGSEASKVFNINSSERIYNFVVQHFRTWINNSMGSVMTPLKNERYYNFDG